jgi:hypothetical protein
MEEAEKKARLWHSLLQRGTVTHANVDYLLGRLEELEIENERLEKALRRWIRQVEDGGGVETRAYVMAKNELRGLEMKRSEV